MRTVLTLLICLITTNVYATCVGEVKDVRMDIVRGSIIVETQYTLSGTVVDVKGEACPACLGQSRYLKAQGTNTEIIALAKKDIATHCEALLKRIPANKAFLRAEMIKHQKAVSNTILADIKTATLGHKVTKTEAIVSFKGKDIKVTHDSINIVTDTP